MSLHLSIHNINSKTPAPLLPVVCIRVYPLVRFRQLQPRLLQLLARYPVLIVATLQQAGMHHAGIHRLRRHHQCRGAHREAVPAVGLPGAPELAVGPRQCLELRLLYCLGDSGARPQPGLDLVGVGVPQLLLLFWQAFEQAIRYDVLNPCDNIALFTLVQISINYLFVHLLANHESMIEIHILMPKL